MIALAAPRFKWLRLANLAWPGLDLAYVLCEQRMMMIMMMMLNGLAHGTGWDVDVDMAHANAGHKREFKSHLYNRMLRVVFVLAIWLLFLFLAIFFCGWAANATASCTAQDFSFYLVWVLVLGVGGTQQVNGSVGELDLQLQLARSNSVSWLPGSLGSTWRVTIGRQKRPFENALDEANELSQVQVQQGVGTAAVGTVGVGTASVGTASVGNVFEQSKCMVSWTKIGLIKEEKQSLLFLSNLKISF